jgi:DNA-binding transcriptional MerR regulator
LTGLKPDTLRVWERRYSLGASYKSPTGRRQYTQTDLDHLQLVAALVQSGARIGEIASSERKTLERLVELRGEGRQLPSDLPKPRVLFIGSKLASWLDSHQGCLSGVDAQVAAESLAGVRPEDLADIGALDVLVVEITHVGNESMQRLDELRTALAPHTVLVMHEQCSERWMEELVKRQTAHLAFPPEAGELAFFLSQTIAEKTTKEGVNTLADLVTPRPRMFDEAQLNEARKLKSRINCECPQHITSLIEQLADFEAYSAECSVEDWQDAAVHATIYALTSQARWLMEKALDTVAQELEGPGSN